MSLSLSLSLSFRLMVAVTYAPICSKSSDGLRGSDQQRKKAASLLKEEEGSYRPPEAATACIVDRSWREREIESASYLCVCDLERVAPPPKRSQATFWRPTVLLGSRILKRSQINYYVVIVTSCQATVPESRDKKLKMVPFPSLDAATPPLITEDMCETPEPSEGNDEADNEADGEEDDDGRSSSSEEDEICDDDDDEEAVPSRGNSLAVPRLSQEQVSQIVQIRNFDKVQMTREACNSNRLLPFLAHHSGFPKEVK
jgi:hypothetical protein